MKKVFLDTNIIIDFLDSTRENNDKSKFLISYLLENGFVSVVSEDMLSTIAYLARKNLTHQQSVIEFLKKINLDSNFCVAHFGQSVVNMACDYFLKNGGDFEDYLQYFCAEKENCIAIYTMDTKFPHMKIPLKRYGDLVL